MAAFVLYIEGKIKEHSGYIKGEILNVYDIGTEALIQGSRARLC